MPGRIEFGLLQADLRWTGINIGADQLPGGALNPQIMCDELTGEVRSLTAPDITAGLGDLNPIFALNGKSVAFTRYFGSSFGGQLYTLALSPDGKAAGKPEPVSS